MCTEQAENQETKSFSIPLQEGQKETSHDKKQGKKKKKIHTPKKTRVLVTSCGIIYQCSYVRFSVMSDSLQAHGLLPTRLLCLWDSPGNSTGVDCHFLLQGILPTQGLNLGLPLCRQTLYHLSHQGSPSTFTHTIPLARFFIKLIPTCHLHLSLNDIFFPICLQNTALFHDTICCK